MARVSCHAPTSVPPAFSLGGGGLCGAVLSLVACLLSPVLGVLHLLTCSHKLASLQRWVEREQAMRTWLCLPRIFFAAKQLTSAQCAKCRNHNQAVRAGVVLVVLLRPLQ